VDKPGRSLSRPIITGIGVLIILAAVAGFYYTTSTGSSSQSSEISSLNQVVSSQQSEIQGLQSAQATATSISTVTVTGSNSQGQATTTVTNFSTTTSHATTTVTIGSTFTTILTAGGTNLYAVSGTLNILNANGSGTLQVMVSDDGQDPITDIAVTIPIGGDPTADLCTNQCTLQMQFNGNPVSSGSPLPGENNAVGTLSTTEGQVGTTYMLTVSITFADGSAQSQQFTVTAQN
jgi:hypothetical protein